MDDSEHWIGILQLSFRSSILNSLDFSFTDLYYNISNIHHEFKSMLNKNHLGTDLSTVYFSFDI